jgi:hypothetical protein
MEYKCKKCDGEEFITQPNRYDVYKNHDGALVLKSSELIDEPEILYCRDCSEIFEK